jgi:hypothetical protein
MDASLRGKKILVRLGIANVLPLFIVQILVIRLSARIRPNEIVPEPEGQLWGHGIPAVKPAPVFPITELVVLLVIAISPVHIQIHPVSPWLNIVELHSRVDRGNIIGQFEPVGAQ